MLESGALPETLTSLVVPRIRDTGNVVRALGACAKLTVVSMGPLDAADIIEPFFFTLMEHIISGRIPNYHDPPFHHLNTAWSPEGMDHALSLVSHAISLGRFQDRKRLIFSCSGYRFSDARALRLWQTFPMMPKLEVSYLCLLESYSSAQADVHSTPAVILHQLLIFKASSFSAATAAALVAYLSPVAQGATLEIDLGRAEPGAVELLLRFVLTSEQNHHLKLGWEVAPVLAAGPEPPAFAQHLIDAIRSTPNHRGGRPRTLEAVVSLAVSAEGIFRAFLTFWSSDRIGRENCPSEWGPIVPLLHYLQRSSPELEGVLYTDDMWVQSWLETDGRPCSCEETVRFIARGDGWWSLAGWDGGGEGAGGGEGGEEEEEEVGQEEDEVAVEEEEQLDM
jgi:hypothetical protein